MVTCEAYEFLSALVRRSGQLHSYGNYSIHISGSGATTVINVTRDTVGHSVTHYVGHLSPKFPIL